MENQYRKKPNRLTGFDYSTPGYYFITICTKNHLGLLGKIVSENELIPAVMELNAAGQIVKAVAEEIPYHYPSATLDKDMIMPNHAHMILVLKDNPQTGLSIHTIIQQFKRAVSIRIGESIWQPRFYDHIIRSEREYQEIWKYIDNNPAKWALDKYYHEM